MIHHNCLEEMSLKTLIVEDPMNLLFFIVEEELTELIGK